MNAKPHPIKTRCALIQGMREKVDMKDTAWDGYGMTFSSFIYPCSSADVKLQNADESHQLGSGKICKTSDSSAYIAYQ